MKTRMLVMLGILLILSMNGCTKKEVAVQSGENNEEITEQETVNDEEIAEQEITNDEDESTESEQETGFVTYETESVYDDVSNDDISATLATSVYELIHITSTQYPQLKTAVDQWNTSQINDYKTTFSDCVEFAKDTYAENPENWFGYYTIESHLNVKRSDSQVFSFLEKWDSFMGGAHPNYGYYGHNYDVKTGKELLINDVVSDTDQLITILEQKLIETYTQEIFFQEDLAAYMKEYYLEGPEEERTKFQFIIGYEGLTFYFSPYELAPHAAGMQKVCLLYSEYPDLIKVDDIKNAPENYALQMSKALSDLFVIDGTLRDVSIFGIMNEYEGFSSLEITIDEQTVSKEIFSYDITPYYVKNQGKSYLYIKFVSENDYEDFMIFALQGTNADYIGTIEGGIRDFNNPADFRIEQRMHMLSTIGGYRNYHVGDDGIPVADTEEYMIMGDTSLTSVIELEGEIIDQKTGESIGTETLAAGTTFQFVSTDNKSYVKFLVDDGRLVRLSVTNETQLVNGKEAEACFEHIFYAD